MWTSFGKKFTFGQKVNIVVFGKKQQSGFSFKTQCVTNAFVSVREVTVSYVRCVWRLHHYVGEVDGTPCCQLCSLRLATTSLRWGGRRDASLQLIFLSTKCHPCCSFSRVFHLIPRIETLLVCGYKHTTISVETFTTTVVMNDTNATRTVILKT